MLVDPAEQRLDERIEQSRGERHELDRRARVGLRAMHHKHLNRDGMYVQPTFTKAAVAAGLKRDATFSPSLPDMNDAVYAQPLFVDGAGSGPDLLIVTTEANNVYAFNPTTGATVWKQNLGAPVPLGMMMCGNIDPFGVTGTGVIDPVSRTLFVAAMVLPSGAAQKHEVFALSIDTGAIRSGWPVDVGAKAMFGGHGFTVATQGSRGAIALVNGIIYVPFGGLDGDCNPYYGWVVAIPIDDPGDPRFWSTVANGGGIWFPGGVTSDGTDVYVATGNTFVNGNTWSGGEAIVRFTGGANFAMSSYWAPTNWKMLDDSDLDLGASPILFDLAGATPGSLAITFGKDGNAYLLNRNALGSVGAPLSQLGLYSGNITSAPALYSTAKATYVVTSAQQGAAGTVCTTPSSGSIAAVTVVPGAPPKLAPSWCAGTGTGSPIVTTSDGHADAIVWSMGTDGSNLLEAFDGDTGAPIAYPGATTMIPNMHRFNSPIAAKGAIYVAADGGVFAFRL